MNDYRQRIVIGGDAQAGFEFTIVNEQVSALDVAACRRLLRKISSSGGRNLNAGRSITRAGHRSGISCQLDYMLLSPALGRTQFDRHTRHHPRRAAMAHDFSARPGGRALSARRLGPAEGVRPLPGRRDARHGLTEKNMMFDLPRGLVVPVSAIEVRLDPEPHPFEAANTVAIEANWQHEIAANPALFDGIVVLLSQIAYGQGRLVGRCHAVRYATLLQWRRERPAWRGACLRACGAGVQRRCAGCDPHGRPHRQSRQGVFRGGLVRALGLSRRPCRCRLQHGPRGVRGDRASTFRRRPPTTATTSIPAIPSTVDLPPLPSRPRRPRKSPGA